MGVTTCVRGAETRHEGQVSKLKSRLFQDSFKVLTWEKMLQMEKILADVTRMITISALSSRMQGEWAVRRSAESSLLAGRPSRMSSTLVPIDAETSSTSHRRRTDAGFTLIELMVVLLILAILLAIAIPTFLGVTKSANDRAAQSNLNTALVNSKAAFQQNGQSYTGINTTTLQTAEPSLTFTTATIGATTVGQNSIISMFTSSDGNGVVLTAYSKSGNCWIVADNTKAIGTGSATTYTNATAAGTVPVAAGTQYGKVANTTAAACGSGTALTGATYQTNGFPS